MLSVIGIIKGIGILSKIKKFFSKDNLKEIISFCLITIFLITIIMMSIRLVVKKQRIKELQIEIEQLETTNEFLSINVLDYSNKLFIKNSFTNTTYRIIKLTNDFYLSEEDLTLREDFKHDFYKE